MRLPALVLILFAALSANAHAEYFAFVQETGSKPKYKCDFISSDWPAGSNGTYVDTNFNSDPNYIESLRSRRGDITIHSFRSAAACRANLKKAKQ